jgi:hypothetical protein
MQKVTAVSPSNFAAKPNIWDTTGPSYTIGFCQLRFPYQVAETTYLGGVTSVLSSIFNSDPPTSSCNNISGRCDYCTLLRFSTQTLQQVAETTYLGGVTTVLSSVFQLRPSNK